MAWNYPTSWWMFYIMLIYPPEMRIPGEKIEYIRPRRENRCNWYINESTFINSNWTITSNFLRSKSASCLFSCILFSQFDIAFPYATFSSCNDISLNWTWQSEWYQLSEVIEHRIEHYEHPCKNFNRIECANSSKCTVCWQKWMCRGKHNASKNVSCRWLLLNRFFYHRCKVRILPYA